MVFGKSTIYCFKLTEMDRVCRHLYYRFRLELINKVEMNMKDFKGIFKYKLIIPTIFVISWVMMLVGQTRVFQDEYQAICLIIVTKEGLRLTLFAIYAFYSWIKAKGSLQRARNIQNRQPELNNELSQNLIHIFVLPNCKQPIDLLAETIGQMAKHSWAKQRYALFLAMEAHEENSDQKAKQLISMFKDKFLHMDYTRHILRPHEQKWKASNASWCVQHLEEIYFKPYNINPENILITAPDADSWVPEIYIHEVQRHYFAPQNYDNRQYFIYCPNQIFMINNHDVPVLNRTLDELHASVHSANMISVFDITFPLSNYTFSYKLIKEMDYWDTCTDTIADDYHTILKSIWKTQGKARSIPIFTPFNQVNLATGKGYCSDMNAKFWQAERHATGVIDVAYGFNMIEKNPFEWRSFLSAIITFDTYLPAATLPWAMISLVYQGLILSQYEKESAEVISFFYVNIFINYIGFATFFIYLFYFLIKKEASEVLYNKQESWWRIVEVMLLLAINTFLVNIPCLTIGSFSVLFANKEFDRSDKVLDKKPALDSTA